MDNFNKIVSFVLGLVVIVVFIAVLTGRFKLRDKIPFLSGKVTPTPTLTIPTPSALPTPIAMPTTTYHSYTAGNKPNPPSIPSTGSPTFLFPLLLAGLATGSYLKRKI